MIDWSLVFTHSLWILGLSIVLAVISYHDWRRKAPNAGRLLESSPSRMARLCRLVAAAELPIMLAMTPALLFPTPGRLVVLAVVPVVWYCAKVAGDHPIPRTPLNVALWLMVAMVGVSLYATFDIRFSLGKVSGLVLGVLLFWASARWMSTPGRLKVGAAAFVLAGAALAVIGLLGTNFYSTKFPVFWDLTEKLPMMIRGVPGAEGGFNRNAVSGCLVLFVPLQVALLVSGAHRWLLPGTWKRWIGWCVVLVEAVLLFLSAGTVVLFQSRSAWIGLAVGTLAFMVWQSRVVRVVVALATGAGLVLVITLGPGPFVNRALGYLGEGAVESISVRVPLWSKAIRGIQDYPVTGMGMNAFRKIGPMRYQAELTAPTSDVVHAHNLLLQAALDLGIPGLVAYTSIWLLAAALLVMVYHRAQEQVYRTIAGGVGAGLIAHFVFGMTDAIPLGAKPGVLFWLILGFTVALHRIALAPPHASGTSNALQIS